MLLDWTDVIERTPGTQLVTLSDGRLFVRHAKGKTIRPAFPLETLQLVLAEVDGQRSVGEICSRLPQYEEEDLRQLLHNLCDDVVRLKIISPENSVEMKPRPKLLIRGDRTLALALATEPALDGIPCSFAFDGDPVPSLAQFDLCIALPNGSDYATCLTWSEEARAADLPILFLAGEAGQIFLSPIYIKGQTACLGCCLLDANPGLATPTPLVDLGQLQVDIDDTAVLPELAAYLSALLREDAESSLFTARLELLPQKRRHLTTPSPSCTHCKDLSPSHAVSPFKAHLRARAEAALFQVHMDFTKAEPKHGAPPSFSIGILGGGSAGYLAALAFAQKLPHAQVTLIASSDIPVIGVGEATTPLLPQFLHADLGLDVVDLFTKVNPTFKLGIQFDWGKHRFNYPFGPVRALEPACYDDDLTACSLQSLMMQAHKLPLHNDGSGALSWLPGHELAYHLDNKSFVAWLTEKASERDIQIKDLKIERVDREGDRVTAMLDQYGQAHKFDFYVDCSGFSALLMGETLDSPFHSFEKSLFTDMAVVGPLPGKHDMPPFTRATALDHGWYWDIPQEHERHLGYVFSSAFCSPAQAEEELRGRFPGLGPTRLVRFRSGRRNHFIKGNVAALGNAYGFVEPLESTSLHMLIRQIGLLSQALPSPSQGLCTSLNRQVNDWWDYLAWFLAIHYKFQGSATPFWQAASKETDVSAYEEIIATLKAHGPLTSQRAALSCFSYPDPLWGAEGVDIILGGQGLFPGRMSSRTSHSAWHRWLDQARRLVVRMPGQTELRQIGSEHPEIYAELGRRFRATGPAFN